MRTTSRLLFTAALLTITLAFAVGCKGVTPVRTGIIAPFAPDEIEAAYEAGRDGDWERVCDMLQARPELAKVCFRKHERNTLLHMAARDGNVEAVRSLIAKGAYPNGRNCDRRTPLLECAYDGNVEIARMLISAGAEVNARDKEGYSPLHQASVLGNIEVVKLLLEHNADTNAIGYNSRYSPLHFACSANHTETAKLLLANGAKIDGFDAARFNPLHCAAWNGNDEIVEILIAKGADVNAYEVKEKVRDMEWHVGDEPYFLTDHGNTPLMVAKTISTAKLLRKHGAKLNKHDTDLLVRRLFERIEEMACYEDEDEDETRLAIDEIALIFAKGVDINVRYENKEGESMALCKAMYSHSIELVNFLIDNGADINAINKYGETPLSAAITVSDVEIIKLMIRSGADVNAKLMYDRTPLHEAARIGNIEVIEMLIKRGARVNAIDDAGNTPLDEANSDEVRELLTKHGAKSGEELKEKTTDKEEQP